MAAERTLRTLPDAYSAGLADGVTITLDYLEGRLGLEVLEDGIYKGPMPDELRTWIAGVREREDGDGR